MLLMQEDCGWTQTNGMYYCTAVPKTLRQYYVPGIALPAPSVVAVFPKSMLTALPLRYPPVAYGVGKYSFLSFCI